jgi:flagellar hook-basal body complex protein FliE
MNNNDKYKKYVSFAVGLLLTFSNDTVTSQTTSHKTPKHVTSKFEQQLKEMAGDMNKNCPVAVDNETRLDSVQVLPKNEVMYDYTFINIPKSSVDVKKATESLRPVILSSIKSNADLKFFRDNKVTMSYHYRDKSGEFLFELTFTAKDYNKQ